MPIQNTKLISSLISTLDSAGLSTAYWDDGITNLSHLDYIEANSGLIIPTEVRDFVASEVNLLPLDKLLDVNFQTARTLTVEDIGGLLKRFWSWSAYGSNLSRNSVEAMERFSGVPSSSAPFSPPVNCVIEYCVASCSDNSNEEGYTIFLYLNGGLQQTFLVPANTVIQNFTLNLSLEVGDQVYLDIQRVGSYSRTDITFDMYLKEV